MKSYYNKNVIDDIDLSIVLSPFFNEWYEIVKDVLLHDEFQKRKLFNHHHDMSVWDHSILVSFKSYMVARYYGADARVCAIAGLLHDFYTQAWLYNPELAQLEDGKYVKSGIIDKSKIADIDTRIGEMGIAICQQIKELKPDLVIIENIQNHILPKLEFEYAD